jgi:hypothetical protein
MFTEGLPNYNRYMLVTGASMAHINDSTFTLRTLHPSDFPKNVVLFIRARQDASLDGDTGVVVDSILIPVK